MAWRKRTVMNETWQERNRRLPGSPPSYAESPLASVWARASDRHAMAADNIACIREVRREENAGRPLRPWRRS
jgi:hypothetical protein